MNRFEIASVDSSQAHLNQAEVNKLQTIDVVEV